MGKIEHERTRLNWIRRKKKIRENPLLMYEVRKIAIATSRAQKETEKKCNVI